MTTALQAKFAAAYHEGGATAVYDLANFLGIKDWTYCRSCNAETPNLPHGKPVQCAVCGSPRHNNWQYHQWVPSAGRRVRYVVEPRTPDGDLDMSRSLETSKLFPVSGVTEKSVTGYYFRHNPGASSASMETVWEWYRAQGLCVRHKYW